MKKEPNTIDLTINSAAWCYMKRRRKFIEIGAVVIREKNVKTVQQWITVEA